eukprot:6709899-Alexandrium_andersonii.AAC.1
MRGLACVSRRGEHFEVLQPLLQGRPILLRALAVDCVEETARILLNDPVVQLEMPWLAQELQRRNLPVTKLRLKGRFDRAVPRGAQVTGVSRQGTGRDARNDLRRMPGALSFHGLLTNQKVNVEQRLPRETCAAAARQTVRTRPSALPGPCSE